MSNTDVYDVIVIGGGVAGLSAALYTSRQGLRTLVVSIDIGGQLSYANVIENYPGVESISGLNLVLKIQRQAISFGAEIVIDEVVSLSRENELFVVRTRKGSTYRSIAVIAACGKAPKRLNVTNEDNLVGKGVSYCVICDAPLYRGKEVALVSFGEKGIESLEILSSLASEVHYIVPNNNDPSIQIAKQLPNVVIYPGYQVKGLVGDDHIEEVVIGNREGNDIRLKIDGIFVELGFEVRAHFLKDFVDFNDKGEVIADALGRTKTEGLFVAGDIVNMQYKQAIIAAASGVISALSAINYVYKYKGMEKSITSDWKKNLKMSKRSLRL
ncbi:MAG: FAD-dependent oxidoreductase [Ignisphaera sp.]